MTEKIPLSHILAAHGTAEEYARVVQVHVDNLAAWHAHHDGAPDDHLHRYPYPDPHEVVRRGVRRMDDGSFAADYEVVDDVSGPRFEQKKAALLAAVVRAEEAEAVKIAPVGKRREWNMRMSDISSAEAEAVRALVAGGVDSEDAQVRVVQDRAPEVAEFLRDQEARRAAMDRLVRHGAQLMSQVEDLTPDTINAWKPSPLEEKVS